MLYKNNITPYTHVSGTFPGNATHYSCTKINKTDKHVLLCIIVVRCFCLFCIYYLHAYIGKTDTKPGCIKTVYIGQRLRLFVTLLVL